MGSDPAPKERARLAEDELRRILERAARLDAEHVTGITVEDLRQIAAETGISSEALALALREAEEGDLPSATAEDALATGPPRPERATPIGKVLRRIPGWIRTIGLVWGSAVTGIFAGLSGTELPNGEAVVFAAFVALVWGGFELAAFHRRRGTLMGFERDLLALWLPFTTAGAMLFGSNGEDFFLAGSMFWLGLAVIGGLIAVVRRTTKKETVSAE